MYATADNIGSIWINNSGEKDISGGWTGGLYKKGDITSFLKLGFNHIKVCAYNQGGQAGLLVHIAGSNIQDTFASTNRTWLISISMVFYNTGVTLIA